MLLNAEFEIDGKVYNTQKDWGLGIKGIDNPSPTPKTHVINVPFGDNIDFSDIYGGMAYENKQIVLTLEKTKDNWIDWSVLISKISNIIHGKKCKLFLDTDKDYYWIGRASVNSKKDVFGITEYTIVLDAEPYKYCRQTSREIWIWDTFNFKTDVIRQYIDLKVEGERTLRIVGSVKPTVLVIETTNKVTLESGTIKIDLPKAGKYEIPDIEIVDGINVIKFTGNATITIDYRGTSL